MCRNRVRLSLCAWVRVVVQKYIAATRHGEELTHTLQRREETISCLEASVRSKSDEISAMTAQYGAAREAMEQVSCRECMCV